MIKLTPLHKWCSRPRNCTSHFHASLSVIISIQSKLIYFSWTTGRIWRLLSGFNYKVISTKHSVTCIARCGANKYTNMAVQKHQILYQILILEVVFSIGHFACLDLPDLCPEICCCSRAKTNGRFSSETEGLKADCSRKNLTSIPPGLSNKTTEL